VPFDVELDHRDFVEAMTSRPEPADAAWCSLSIHHLQTDEKLRLMQAVHEATSTMLMIYEPTREDGEAGQGYLQRFRRINRAAWTTLTDEEWMQVDHHVTTCDFPAGARPDSHKRTNSSRTQRPSIGYFAMTDETAAP
jgi:hypothetical protein